MDFTFKSLSNGARFLSLASSIVCAAPAYAIQYLTLEEAQKVLFPEYHNFTSNQITLSEQQRTAIEERSDQSLPEVHIPYWTVASKGKVKGYFFVDQVIGKHELISYAVGFSAERKILGVEILEYRETHGGEIKDPEWRKQFIGKTSQDSLKIEQDIKNISGATLSCIHITEGVRKLTQILEVSLGQH